ncbi:MAG: hypothetical protein FJ098_03865, partial [Deltaproteobacteria bacterium]|nr:hypothetical protein [Deltaproteobacteria bacterium]
TASWDALQGVTASSPLYVKARYLMGAILVSQSRLDEAVTAFEEVVARAAPAADAPIAELAYLSLARLAYEQGQISRAADLYQRIPFQSRNFQRALYEMTHLHIRSSGLRDNPDERFEDLRKALETLEILAGAPDLGSKLSVETAILRGRINMLLGMLNYANEAYKEVVDRFAPMSNELWEFSQDAERIGRWFESLVHEQVDPIGRFEVLSRDAAEWIREEPDLGQVVRSLQDLGQQKKDLEESAEILGKLRAALDQPGVRNLFPALRTAWLDSLELEAGLEDFGSQLLDWQQETLGKALTDEERQRIATLRAERELLEKQLKDKPRTAAGYEARDRASLEDLQEMERDLDEQLLRIQGYKDQVDAMLRVLREVKYKGSYDLEVRDEDDVRAELEKETAALAELYDQTLAVKLKVQRDMLLGSGGEEAARSEGDRQAALQAGQKEEAALYLEAARRAGASGNPLLQAAAEGQKIITSELVHLGEIRRLIDERAAMKVTFYRGMIEGEAKQLAVNATEFEQTERRSLEVARSMGTPLFLAANDRLGSVVLEADLGLVDLAWQRKQEYTEQLDFLGEEKGRKIGFLQKLLDEATQEVE